MIAKDPCTYTIRILRQDQMLRDHAPTIENRERYEA